MRVPPIRPQNQQREHQPKPHALPRSLSQQRQFIPTPTTPAHPKPKADKDSPLQQQPRPNACCSDRRHNSSSACRTSHSADSTQPTTGHTGSRKATRTRGHGTRSRTPTTTSSRRAQIIPRPQPFPNRARPRTNQRTHSKMVHQQPVPSSHSPTPSITEGPRRTTPRRMHNHTSHPKQQLHPTYPTSSGRVLCPSRYIARLQEPTTQINPQEPDPARPPAQITFPSTHPVSLSVPTNHTAS